MIYAPMNTREGQPTAHFDAVRSPAMPERVTRSTKRGGGGFRAVPSMTKGGRR